MKQLEKIMAARDNDCPPQEHFCMTTPAFAATISKKLENGTRRGTRGAMVGENGIRSQQEQFF